MMIHLLRKTRAIVAVGAIGMMASVPAHTQVAVPLEVAPALQYEDATIASMLGEDEGVEAEAVPQAEDQVERIATGRASYYGRELAGNRTASGERFNPRLLTAAHRKLPMGSKLRVTNLANGRSVVVRVNDRGPFHGARIIDVSLAAAEEIGMIGSGTANVSVDLLR